MTVVCVKGNLDTEVHMQGKSTKGTQKMTSTNQGERPERELLLIEFRIQPNRHLDFGPLTSRTVR